jgi:branched-chain amino acid transport system ATP-binding protein
LTVADTILETTKLRKEFSSVVAVDGMTWSVERGEARGIIGPNGAGKSTFFNLISGNLRPSSGDIYYDGDRITSKSMDEIARKGVVKTYQLMNIFEGASVYENVRVAAQQGVSTYDMFHHHENLPGVDDRAQEVLERVGIAERASVEAGSLPYGDQRKLEIGIALVGDPGVILLDEPTSGMSEEQTIEVLDLLKDLSANTSLTLVIIEHDIELILEIAERLTVMHQGKILSEGTPDEITADDDVQHVYLEG